MTGTTTPTPAVRRRSVFAVQAAVLVFALTTCCALLIVLGDRFSLRQDVTATRRHRLSPQSLAIAQAVSEPLRLYVAVRMSDLAGSEAGRVTLNRLRDVADAFAATGKLRVELLDISSGRSERFAALLKELVEQDRAAIDAYSQSVGATGRAAGELAQALSKVADDLALVRDAVLTGGNLPASAENFRSAFDSLGGQLRAAAANLQTASTETATLISTPPKADDPLPVSRSDLAPSQLRQPLSEAAKALASCVEWLDSSAGPSRAWATPTAKDRAAALTLLANSARDRAARELLALDRLPALRIFSVAKAIKNSQAALLVGPQRAPGPDGSPAPASVVALDLDELLTVRQSAADGAAVDLRFRSEELIAAGLAAFSTDVKPVVVLMHGGSAPLSPRWAGFTQMTERFALRGFDLVEWAAGLDDQPPAAVSAAQRAARPIVYVSISPEARDAAGAMRMAKLAKRLEELASGGAAMLVSVTPSTLPGADQPDPMVSWLAAFGVRADTGRIIVEEVATPSGRGHLWSQSIVKPGSTHPIAAAIEGLPTQFILPIALEATPAAGVTSAAVAVLPPLATRWGESDWSSALSSRGALAPSPAGPRDVASPAGGFVLALAVEREAAQMRPDAPTRQRLLVVGSNGWFVDPIVAPRRVVDGMMIAEAPGNLELLEAGVWWLAGREDRILRSATAESVPLVPNLSAGAMSALRWGLIGGLPLGVLLLGAIVLLRRR